MIFVTVGTQFPFDRMVETVDRWAARAGRDDVVAQVGPSTYQVTNIRCVAMMAPEEMRQTQQDASLIIAHAGMGSIVTALELGKPILIMPRRFANGEHRNDHQVETVKWIRETRGVYVAMDEVELEEKLNDLDSLLGAGTLSKKAPQAFIDAVRDLINGGGTVSQGADEPSAVPRNAG